ncbi:MAG TPA: TIGR03621 family F420-dependent LLM class oxidoreductase [Candidatus Limnocylindrales bacterium]
MVRPFRFIAPMPALRDSPGRWRDAVRRIEALGFSTVAISDHLTRGWSMDPLVAMTAAAEATDRLRVLSLVLSNDYRHPAILHRAAAMIDVLSAGRLELGLGAGWMPADYEAVGLPFGSPALRLERLEEAVRIIKALFGGEPVTVDGKHYRLAGLEGLPGPVQRPHPPILIGGGGKRVLSLAAREADIVGIHARLAGRELDAEAVADLAPERIAEKVRWIAEAARAAGRDADAIELQFSVYLCRIAGSSRSATASVSSFAGLLGSDPDLVARSPAVLVGSVDRCVELLEERRERFSLSYLNLGGDIEAVAPIVARLSGR